ncbi:MAG: LapA family protein [Gordonia sp. (in: high G+C Gram-positive bacteria)]|uniref:LapA family protein n=1 Tax=Gordonia sp. (in: high G+C Gram-positive bacteria) TaxID=84139 RepID=UPI003C70BC4D
MSAPEQTGSPAITFLRRYWLPILLAVLAIVFIAQNRDGTSTSLFWFSFNAPLWLTLTVVTVIAFVCGVLVGRRPSKKA